MKFIPKKIAFKRTKLFLAGIGVASFVGIIIVLTLTLSGKEPPKLPPAPENPQGADIIINNFEYASTNAQGVKEWTLKSDTASYFQDNKVVGFKKVNATFYTKEGRTFTVRGDRGTLNTESKDFELSGNVVGTSSDGYTFRTETLAYSADKSQARTNKKVYLENPQVKLEGTGMVLDVKEQKVFLANSVTAKITKTK